MNIQVVDASIVSLEPKLLSLGAAGDETPTSEEYVGDATAAAHADVGTAGARSDALLAVVPAGGDANAGGAMPGLATAVAAKDQRITELRGALASAMAQRDALHVQVAASRAMPVHLDLHCFLTYDRWDTCIFICR